MHQPYIPAIHIALVLSLQQHTIQTIAERKLLQTWTIIVPTLKVQHSRLIEKRRFSPIPLAGYMGFQIWNKKLKFLTLTGALLALLILGNSCVNFLSGQIRRCVPYLYNVDNLLSSVNYCKYTVNTYANGIPINLRKVHVDPETKKRCSSYRFAPMLFWKYSVSVLLSINLLKAAAVSLPAKDTLDFSRTRSLPCNVRWNHTQSNSKAKE